MDAWLDADQIDGGHDASRVAPRATTPTGTSAIPPDHMSTDRRWMIVSRRDPDSGRDRSTSVSGHRPGTGGIERDGECSVVQNNGADVDEPMTEEVASWSAPSLHRGWKERTRNPAT